MGLTDTQAYRLTLVLSTNLTAPGDGTGTFVDGNADGAADAGASEAIALITMVNGVATTAPGVKTVPDAADDPANPTGMFPTGGQITVTIAGIAAGSVYPVAYENGGTTTFLELDSATLMPTENYGVAGLLTVQ